MGRWVDGLLSPRLLGKERQVKGHCGRFRNTLFDRLNKKVGDDLSQSIYLLLSALF